jgi:transcriptional regulator GlxA family with amidase domain
MPTVLVVKDATLRDKTMGRILDAMGEEVVQDRLGSATITARLADVLITRIIRNWAESQPAASNGWIAAIRDPRIGRVIAAVHREPGHAWSMDSLAAMARMSRSVFAERFASVMGIPPGKYVAHWRMHTACEWLRSDRTTVAEAATRLGYDSEAAFSRAFKRFAGRPPSAVRRDGRATNGAAPSIRERKARAD